MRHRSTHLSPSSRRGRRVHLGVVLGAVVALSGCLPALEDACVGDEQCPVDRHCIGGVCAPHGGGDGGSDRGADGPIDSALEAGPLPDARALDAGLPDREVPDDGRPDGGQTDLGSVDRGPEPDAGPASDGGCLPEPAACNQLDDNCNGEVDEQAEAVEGCPAVMGTLASCGLEGCQYACVPGAVPVRQAPADGCRIPRRCVLDPAGWIQIADGLLKSEDPGQQVAIVGAGDQRFVAVYDVQAEGQDRIVRSFVFDADAPDEAEEQRLGDQRDAHDGTLIGLIAAAVGERFVAAAWRLLDGDGVDSVQLMARDADGITQRDVRIEWPQPPALAVITADPPALVTLVETHIDRAADPSGRLVADRWLASEDGDEVDGVLQPGEPRPTGPAQNAALTLRSGRILMLSDTVIPEVDGSRSYQLQADLLTPDLALGETRTIPLAGPVIDRITTARGANGFVVLTVIGEAEGGALELRVARSDGAGFLAEVVRVDWERRAPVHSQALALPGGPGALYRQEDDIHLVLPDPAWDDFAFDDILPGTENKIRALAAWQPDGATVEVVAVREERMDGKLIFGRYVCH